MTDPSKEEERALSRDELELVSAARQPALRAMHDRALGELVTLLRERRDRARTLADRQRREMRGKVAPAGASAAADNGGTRSKEHFLGAALARAMQERERRQKGETEAMTEKKDDGRSQHDIAEKALEMRREAEKHAPEHPANTPTPDKGMQPNPNDDAEPTVQQEAFPEIIHKSRTPRG